MNDARLVKPLFSTGAYAIPGICWLEGKLP
jgi:hypothetical protein